MIRHKTRPNLSGRQAYLEVVALSLREGHLHHCVQEASAGGSPGHRCEDR
jgi:hypothetical protein